MKSLRQYIRESLANKGIRLEFVSNQTGKDTYLDVLSLLDDIERDLLKDEKLIFKVWEETDRETKDITGGSGSYNDPEEVANKFDRAVSVTYNSWRNDHQRRKNARVNVLKKIDRPLYKSIYGNIQHVRLFSVEVYRYYEFSVRVTLEAIYHNFDYNHLCSQRNRLKNFGYNTGDLITFGSGDEIKDQMVIIADDSQNADDWEFGIGTKKDVSYVWLRRENDADIDYIPHIKTNGMSHTYVLGKNNKLYRLIDPENGHHIRYNLKITDNIRINDKQDIKTFIGCLENWISGYTAGAIDDETKEYKDSLKNYYERAVVTLKLLKSKL